MYGYTKALFEILYRGYEGQGNFTSMFNTAELGSISTQSHVAA